MKVRDDIITTRFFDSYPKDAGLVIDFADVADLLPEDAGEGYVQSTDWRIGSSHSYSSKGEGKDIQVRRAKDAESRIIGSFDVEPQDELVDFGAGGMLVKKVGDMHLALPQTFDFALSRVNTAAFDALKLYGPELFGQAEMMLIVQRTDIEPEEAHRNVFSRWHNHRDNGENVDMVYSFFNVMGTENQLTSHDGRQIVPVELVVPDASILRIGGEIAHRSQTNNTDHDIRREWGALIINFKPPTAFRNRNYLSHNPTMVGRDSDLFDGFKDKAAEILSSDTRVHALDEPETVIDELGIDVEYTMD